MAIVAVTGASGYVGQFVVKALAPHRTVRIVDIAEPRYPHEAEFVRADVRELSQLHSAFEGAEAVVHMAALVRDRTSRPLRDFADIMVLGTWNALEAAVDTGVRRFVSISSIIATGHPLSDVPTLPIRAADPPHFSPLDLPEANLRYSLGKLLGEQLAHAYRAAHGLDIVVVRPGVVAGDGVNGEPRRPENHPPYWFMYVHPEDLAHGIARAVLTAEAPARVYNIVAGRVDSLYDWEPARRELDYAPTHNWDAL